mmetsp:Transcript_46222/g.144972  ORF Transcript_46222/g.144972 Transcript_46222/m.144972 type:complete len:259 (-) Transcript_46222:379-1155(-)
MMITQGDRLSPLVSSMIVPNVPLHSSCSSLPAHLTILTGVLASRPPRIRRPVTSSSFDPLMRSTSVSMLFRASRSAGDALVASCPDRTAKLRESSGSVRGTPARRGAAVREERPGTSSNDTPAVSRCSISDLVLPKMRGSPALSLTIHLLEGSAESSTRSRSMSCCFVEVSFIPPLLPTNNRSQCAGTRERSSSSARESYTTASARFKTSCALTVRCSTPPMPAPTMKTLAAFSVCRPALAASTVEKDDKDSEGGNNL